MVIDDRAQNTELTNREEGRAGRGHARSNDSRPKSARQAPSSPLPYHAASINFPTCKRTERGRLYDRSRGLTGVGAGGR